MNLKGIFKEAFPFIATAANMGGPLGSMAASAVGKALGVTVSKPEDISDAIMVASGTDPEVMMKLKVAEQEFMGRMTELGFSTIEKLEEIASRDRDSARNREITIKDKVPARMSFVVTAGFFGLLALLLFVPVPTAVHDLILTMIGWLGNSWSQIITYYYGSSLGSTEKNQILHNITKE
jgi:hypothetical protein